MIVRPAVLGRRTAAPHSASPIHKSDPNDRSLTSIPNSHPLATHRMALRSKRRRIPRPRKPIHRRNPALCRLSSQRCSIRPALHCFSSRVRVLSNAGWLARRPLGAASRPRGRSHVVGHFHCAHRRRAHGPAESTSAPPTGALSSRSRRSRDVSLLESIRRTLDPHPRTRARQWADLRRSRSGLRSVSLLNHLHHDSSRLAHFLLDLCTPRSGRGTDLVPRLPRLARTAPTGLHIRAGSDSRRPLIRKTCSGRWNTPFGTKTTLRAGAVEQHSETPRGLVNHDQLFRLWLRRLDLLRVVFYLSRAGPRYEPEVQRLLRHTSLSSYGTRLRGGRLSR